MLESSLGRVDRVLSSSPKFAASRQGSRTLNGHRFSDAQHTASVMTLEEVAEAPPEAVIVVACDFSESSLEAVKAGISLARHLGGKLVMCHALYPRCISFRPGCQPWVIGALRQEARQKMKAVLEMGKEKGLTATGEIEEGTPADVIVKVARRWDADLLVLTTRKQGIWSRLFFGRRTTERVLEEAECHAVVLREV
jgi:nucleotide-binding universal stress UspA family protein